MKELLKDNYILYSNGLICETHGFGIGAYGYYRRILELHMHILLRNAELEFTNKEELSELIEDTKNSHFASKKIELIKKWTPASLKPGGHNPLALMYEFLSEGIHNMSDKDCLNMAEIIRDSLEAYLVSMHANKDAIAKLTKNTKVLKKIKDTSKHKA
jgi:hypothetical protein